MTFFVFAGEYYYPCGGMNDWVATCETRSDAIAVVKSLNKRDYEWYHIFDTDERAIVESGKI